MRIETEEQDIAIFNKIQSSKNSQKPDIFFNIGKMTQYSLERKPNELK